MRRRWSLRVASAVIVVGVVLATPTTVQAEGGQTVTIHDYQYHPDAITVSAGTAVTWTNEDTAKHDIATTAGPAAIASPELGQGESFTFTFVAPGAYQYLCTIHPDMLASVSVTPAPTTTTTTTTATTGAPAEARNAAGFPVAADTTTTTAAIAAGAESESAAPAVAAASVRDDDLASSSRPYLLLLATVAAVVASSLLLLGVGRRAEGG